MSKRGQKICLECGKATGARTHTCECGYNFLPKKKNEKPVGEKSNSQEVEVVEKIGKGRKKCPECGTIVGVRTKECSNCQFNFFGKKEEIEPEEKQVEPEVKETIDETEDPEIDETVEDVENPEEEEEDIDNIEVEEYIEKTNGITMNGAIYFTPDEHADRILEYGANRIKNLLKQAKNGNCWKHVNWKRVEEGLALIKE